LAILSECETLRASDKKQCIFVQASKMKAIVKFASGHGNVEIRDVPEPSCDKDHIKLEIGFCGVCGTDIHVLQDTFRNYPPVILGHEFAGTVTEVGENVKGIVEGDRGAGLGATAVTCGHCSYCLSGHFIFCLNRRGMGHGVNGAFARYVVIRPDQFYRVPEHLTMEEASLSEPFAAAIQAVEEVTEVRPSDTALISGPGPIGLLCLKLLVAKGVKTIVAGAAGDDLRLQAALQFGAFKTIDISKQNFLEEVIQIAHGRGVDVAFECAGHEQSVRGCLLALRPMGRYTQVGICGHEIQFRIDQVFYKQLHVRGSVCYTADTWRRMMNIFSEGRIRLSDLVSAKLPISQWQTAFSLCTDRTGLKVLMYPED
jgi:L-iditol 2-dehydrogenase